MITDTEEKSTLSWNQTRNHWLQKHVNDQSKIFECQINSKITAAADFMYHGQRLSFIWTYHVMHFFILTKSFNLNFNNTNQIYILESSVIFLCVNRHQFEKNNVEYINIHDKTLTSRITLWTSKIDWHVFFLPQKIVSLSSGGPKVKQVVNFSQFIWIIAIRDWY